MADDFSTVVQELQLANEKLARLERIQTEGGDAKGINCVLKKKTKEFLHKKNKTLKKNKYH